jgi:hypothetical protein
VMTDAFIARPGMCAGATGLATGVNTAASVEALEVPIVNQLLQPFKTMWAKFTPLASGTYSVRCCPAQPLLNRCVIWCCWQVWGREREWGETSETP